MIPALSQQPKKILVPRFDTLGDLVLLEGLLGALLERYPEAELTLLVQRHYADLSGLFPDRIRWLTTEVNPHQIPAGVAPAQQLLQDLGSHDFDLMLATTHTRTWADDLIAAALQGVVRVGLGHWEPACPPSIISALGLSSDSPYDTMIPVEERIHEIEKYRILWQELTGEVSPLEPRLIVNEHQSQEACQVLKHMGLRPKNFCICFPAGTRKVAIKTWPSDRFADTIAWLESEKGIRTLVAGHISEAECVDATADQAKTRGASPVIWIGRDGDVPILAALSAEAGLYLGNDTGPMHIAAAVGTPVAAIFGGGTWPRFVPRGERSVAIAGEMPCFGCGWWCLFGDAPCMSLVSVADVKKSIQQLLEPAKIATPIVKASIKIGAEADQFITKAVENIRGIEKDRRERLADNYRLHRLLEESETDRQTRLEIVKRQEAQIRELCSRIEFIEADRNARLELINKLGKQLEEIDADRNARLEVIQRLEKQAEEDRRAHLEVIRKLSSQLEDSETDRAARLEVIQKLDEKLQESEADRAARLHIIQKQEATLDQLQLANQKLTAIRNHFLVRALIQLRLIPEQESNRSVNDGKNV